MCDWHAHMHKSLGSGCAHAFKPIVPCAASSNLLMDVCTLCSEHPKLAILPICNLLSAPA